MNRRVDRSSTDPTQQHIADTASAVERPVEESRCPYGAVCADEHDTSPPTWSASRAEVGRSRLGRHGGRGSWPYPPLSSVLPGGLPVGALTVIRLGDVQRPGDWTTAVGGLVDDTVRSRRSTLYVEVGGMFAYANDMWLAQRLPLPQLATDPDEDLVVRAPHALVPASDQAAAHAALTASRQPPTYDCYVPTLLNVAPVLLEQERRHGSTLVILNNIESARPYRLPLGEEPLATRLNVAQRSSWLAKDLLEYAERRKDAPTVATCEVPGQGLDQDLLTAVALLEITNSVSPQGRATFRWRQRACIGGEWSATGILDVPAWLP